MSVDKLNYDEYEKYYKGTSFFKLEVQHKKRTFCEIAKNYNILRKETKILDVGFGFGEMIFQYDITCKLYGLDISRTAVEKAMRNAGKKGYEAAFIEYNLNELLEKNSRLPYENKYFDIIICSHVLEHIRSSHQLLNELYRILNPNGFLLLMVPINENKKSILHLQKYTTNSMLETIRKVNFTPLSVIENGSIFSFVENMEEKIKRVNSILSRVFTYVLNFALLLSPLYFDLAFEKIYYPTNLAILARKN